MLAKVPASQEDFTPAPPSFTATLNPDPKSFTDSFFLTDGNGKPVANLIFIENSFQEISVTLDGGTFFSDPIDWDLHPNDIPELTVSGNTLTFTVPQPEHCLAPWAFRIVANTPDADGVRSQTIFLTKPNGPGPEVDELLYNVSTGTFNLPGRDTGSRQIFLINAGLPGESSSFSLNLDHGLLPADTSIEFAEHPVIWSSGAEPDWITVSRSTSDAQNMTMTISSGGGQAIGFQFAITITKGGTSITVLSPDPILINATIGDG